ncbi:MAG: YggS family pyridoxal phosphate-dependent enzyme [Defluviitaleaceae bacterium]|nr:YggS family pyridoxal phosphate-dependent enzyme [Defluviitaleaceae bacterium]
MNVSDNLKRVNDNIAKSAAKSGRAASDIILIVVTKSVDLVDLQGLQGLHHVGENRAQDLVAKQPHLQDLVWHFLGHLQRNKVGQVLGKAALIHSLDSLRLAEEISRMANQRDSMADVLIEVNIAGEASKHGIVPEEVLEFAEQVIQLPSIAVHGLMTMGPADATESQRRNYFEKMAQLHQDLNKIAQARFLSMGMSGDYEAAIECGANIVRIGRGIFG